ncbi:hypothetical protein ANRL4_05319 [Anaerolineae bacterium]|nr:hypothetical protein ANRL4_05319 [Anaerolineae bacterium]
MAISSTTPHSSRRVQTAFAGIAALLFFLLWVSGGTTRSTVFASPQATPTGALAGIHLGNHVAAEDWSVDLLRRIDPRQGGVLPQVLVVLSSQVYDRPRDLANECRLLNAYIPASRSSIRGYLQYASAQGVRIIIRIVPSPGNMNDLHHLSLAPQPENGDHCREAELPPAGDRSYEDIGEEIIKIHEWNAQNNIAEFGFEPANEPNLEWYDTSEPQAVHRSSTVAWSEMDAYFSAIYDYVHARYPSPAIRVLTPPMSQGLYAEVKNVNGCGLMKLDSTENGHGYEYMPNVFMTGNKNDGYDWHNYWREGFEDWANCDSAVSPHGQHVALWFPPQMLTSMQSKPRNITEADLASPPQNFGNPLTNKDQQLGIPAAASIQNFIDHEVIADHVAIWTLNVTNSDSQEQNWHEAYACNDFVWADPSMIIDPVERPWFMRWWSGIPAGFSFTPCYRVFLPVGSNNFTTELIKNGDFDASGAYWPTTTSQTACRYPDNSPYPVFGVIDSNNAADLGRCNYNMDTVSQIVTIPDVASATLSYKYRVEQTYTAAVYVDYLYVQIHDYTTGEVVTLRTYDDRPPRHSWVTGADIDLSSRRGHNVEVIFKAFNSDSIYPTHFWVDDVSLRITN